LSGSGVLDDGQERPAESEETSDLESVLDLAQRSGAFGNLTLSWHYRSRHQALIAFSNAAFYQNRLALLPDERGGGPDVGVELFYGQGTYRSRTSRDNPDEAARVAQRVIHHYNTHPALSLGVVTFSQAQADAIETALGKACQQRPDLDPFFTTDRLRGFFIKNVEAAQGDERDVLIMSIGYGPDENGQLTMDFGPLSRSGGWRRLNVAITRARYRVEVVSSIRAGDIPESVTSEGLKHLRRYLNYAAEAGPRLPPPVQPARPPGRRG
jgi:superfamily I DNA and/or RNA helicase